MSPVARAAAALVTAALLVAPAVPAAPAAPAGPVLAFDAETCDLGGVLQGERPACTFGLRNAGGGELRLLSVEPTCGCTSAGPAPPPLAPGARGTLRIVFDSEEFAGEVAKEVVVRSNDPGRPAVTLRVLAAVEPEVAFEPAVVTFDPVRPDAELLQVVTLTNRRAEPVRVLALSARPSSVRCVLPAWADRGQPLVLESWDRAVLEVRLSTPQRLVMPLAGECALEIEGPRKRHYRLKILGYPGP